MKRMEEILGNGKRVEGDEEIKERVMEAAKGFHIIIREKKVGILDEIVTWIVRGIRLIQKEFGFDREKGCSKWMTESVGNRKVIIEEMRRARR